MIFNIEEFALYDGPGIRTTVFFKGCPLHCKWCHNPEGISRERMLIVNHSLCEGCGACKSMCKNDTCIACGRCVDECPNHIRRICGYEISASELAERLIKNTEFYETGGGITISGGEPFYQADFLFAVLRELGDIHKAVETSGYITSSVFSRAFNMVDLFIFDIKHTDTVIHKQMTGVDNGLIMMNLQLLKKSLKPFIIRIPLIPGINDGEVNLRETARLIKGSKKLIRVELLPYNSFTGAKYTLLGKDYKLPFDENARLNANRSFFTNNGIECVVL